MKKSKKVFALQTYVVVMYSQQDWRFYSRAEAEGGQSLKVTSIDREVSSCNQYGCLFTEEIAVNLSKKFLNSKKKTGFQLRISGDGGVGKIVLDNPANVVEGFVSAIKVNGGKI